MIGWLGGVHDVIPHGIWWALVVEGFGGGLWSWPMLDGMPLYGTDGGIALLWIFGWTVLPAFALRRAFFALAVTLKLAMRALILRALAALVCGGMRALGRRALALRSGSG
jgi:hypothetical protein